MFNLRYAYATLLQDDSATPCDRDAKIWAWLTGVATTVASAAVILGVVFSA